MYQLDTQIYSYVMKKIEDLRLENARTLAKKFSTLADFADAIDRSATQVSRIIGKNPSKSIGSKMARHIEHCFNLDEGWLDSDHQNKFANHIRDEMFQTDFRVTHGLASGERNYPKASFPLISKVQAGSWSEITEKTVKEAPLYPCPVPCSDKTFVLKVTGDSMLPTYKDGYLIWVDPTVEPRNKSHVIARLDDFNEATFKQLVIEDNLKFLKPLNEDWPEQYIKINGNCTIVGVVVFGGFIPNC